MTSHNDQSARAGDGNDDLPPLPATDYRLFYEDEGDEDHGDEGYQEVLDEPGYTAKEMRDYARAALAAAPAAPPVLPEPAFTLRWDEHSGQYKVNKPGINYAECYTADQVRTMLAAAPAVPTTVEIEWGNPIRIGDIAEVPQRLDGKHTEYAYRIAAALGAAPAVPAPLTDEQVFKALEDEARRLNGGTLDGLQMNEEMLSEVIKIFRIAERTHGIV